MTSTSAPSLSPTTIAGIAIGAVAGVALLAGAYLYLRRLRGSRGRFTDLRRERTGIDPDEEFVSRELSVHPRDRGYRHGQQPSLSLEPLLVPSPPQTYTPRDVPAASISPLYYLPSPVDPVLPPADLSDFNLYDADDPFARIERAILQVSPAHHIPISSRRSPQQLDKPSRKHVPSAPLFINRTLTCPSGPELSSGASLELPQSLPSQTGSDVSKLLEARGLASTGKTGDVSPPKSRRVVSRTPLAERTILKEASPPHRVGGEKLDAQSREFTYPQPATPNTSPPSEHQGPVQSRTSFRRPPRPPKVPGLSPVRESSTSTNLPHPHDNSANAEITKTPPFSLPELEKSSSLSVELSHTALSADHDCTSFPLLSSDNNFGTDSRSSSQRWTSYSSSGGGATRYPSLAPSSSGTSSSSNPHSGAAAEWHRPPVGLAALSKMQLEPTKSSPSSIPRDIPPALRPSSPPTGKKPREAHLRAHSPGSVAEVERRSFVQGGIASIDVSL
jgi:hypothetical protein